MRILLVLFTLFTLFTLLPLIAQDAPKPAQEAAAAPSDKTPRDTGVEGNLDVGYRWVDFRGGSFDTYRSVVNLGEGPKLLNVDALIRSADRKFFDRISVQGMGWGGDPYTTARVDAFKERLYDLRVDYRNIAYYNFLPSFADPLLSRGILSTEQASDTRIRTFDGELRFLPGTRFVPYFAFDRNDYSGSGITTFVVQSNQYPVGNHISNHADRYRTGVQIQFSNFHATLEGGGTTFNDDQQVSYSGDPLYGNRTNPFFGERLSLNSVAQKYRIRGDSIFTRVLASYSPFSWLDLSGQFLYSRPTSDVVYDQTNTGNFVDLQTLEFFASQHDYATAYASQPHSSGSYFIDIHPTRRLRILESLSSDHFHVASSQVYSDLTDVVTTAVQTNPTDRTYVNYNRHQTEAIFDLTSYLTVRGGFRYVWGDAQTEGSITAPQFQPTQTADLSQKVGLVGVQFRAKQKLTVNGDFEVGTTSRAFFRTSLYDYKRSSVRARYQASSSLSFSATQSLTTNSNPAANINLDFLYSQSSLAFQWMPAVAKRFTVLGDYTFSRLRSDIDYIIPQALIPAVSQYRDNAHTITALIEGAPITGRFAPRFSAGGSYFKSAGSRPTAYYQPQARISIPVREHIQWNTEWRWYAMNETFYTFEGFRAHVFMTSLRLTR
jgi:hypothetical protein